MTQTTKAIPTSFSMVNSFRSLYRHYTAKITVRQPNDPTDSTETGVQHQRSRRPQNRTRSDPAPALTLRSAAVSALSLPAPCRPLWVYYTVVWDWVSTVSIVMSKFNPPQLMKPWRTCSASLRLSHAKRASSPACRMITVYFIFRSLLSTITTLYYQNSQSSTLVLYSALAWA